MTTEYVWVLNPNGRKVEVDKALVAELFQRGFKPLTKKETPQEEVDQVYLDVIEI